jgi:hypothetical protein
MTLWISECTVLRCDFFIYAEISSTPGEFYIFKFQQPSKPRRYQASDSAVYMLVYTCNAMTDRSATSTCSEYSRILQAVQPSYQLTKLALLKFIYAPLQILNIFSPVFPNLIYFTFPIFRFLPEICWFHALYFSACLHCLAWIL